MTTSIELIKIEIQTEDSETLKLWVKWDKELDAQDNLTSVTEQATNYCSDLGYTYENWDYTC